MNKTMPVIRESVDELKRLLKQERHHVKHQRLQMLYLVASSQARFRTELAPLLGVDRSTIGRWLAGYETGGLEALLAVYIPAGKKPPLSAGQLAQLQQALQRPEGFASYGEIQRWIATELGVELGYHSVHTIVHDKLGAKPKVPRPSHQKKPHGRGNV
jgi:transposase